MSYFQKMADQFLTLVSTTIKRLLLRQRFEGSEPSKVWQPLKYKLPFITIVTKVIICEIPIITTII